MRKPLIFITLFLVLFLIFYSYEQPEEEYILLEVVDLCGPYPKDYIQPNIENNSNYVFTPDPNFESVRLLDALENVVFVNSFIECEHYVLGGWGYSLNPNYNQSANVPTLICDNALNLKDVYTSSDNVYISEISLSQFTTLNAFKCMGKVETLRVEGTVTNFQVFYSRSGYVFFSQIVPLLTLVLKKHFRKSILVLFLIIYQLLIQLTFNYNFGFNLLNSISVFTTIAISLYILIEKNENN